jgi:hypothetical protein
VLAIHLSEILHRGGKMKMKGIFARSEKMRYIIHIGAMHIHHMVEVSVIESDIADGIQAVKNEFLVLLF